MFKQILLTTILALAILIYSSGFGIAQTGDANPHTVQTLWAWTTEKWDASDRPYQQIRDNIWRSISSGQKPEILDAKYRALAKSEAYHPPYDSVAQFRWAYVAYQAVIVNPQLIDHSDFAAATQALGYGPSPRSYEYARLRFLMEAMSWPDIHLKVAGERLLARVPDDFQVKYQLTHVLASGSTSSQNMNQAVLYAQQLVRAMPSKGRMYGLLGETYYTRWLSGKSSMDGDNAIAAYEKYLALAPPNDSFRHQAQYLIKKIQNG